MHGPLWLGKGVSMGKRGIEIVGVDVGELVKRLNTALADEWLAYYQYWVAARVVRGPMREAVAAELAEHAADELRHAEMIAGRILQLDGTPLLDPQEWLKASHCGYEAPTDPLVTAVLEQNVQGERCAIDYYKDLLDSVQGKDPVTFHMVREILEDEIEHEDDLSALLEDIRLIKKV